jgi:hypothetical protein
MKGASIITLMMEAAVTSEKSVNFYQTTRHNNPEDSHLHIRRSENLKSYLVNIYGEANVRCIPTFASLLTHRPNDGGSKHL